MIVREAQPEDQAVAVGLARQFYSTSSLGRFIGGEPWQLEALFTVVRNEGVLFLAEEDGLVVGMIALVALPHPFSGAIYAEELAWFVLPDHRAGTAGPRLLRAAEEWAGHRNCWCIKMGAPTDQPGVAQFYERRGYEAVETAYIKRCSS